MNPNDENVFQALKPKVKIEGGKELVYREGETATIFADVPSEPAAEDIRWFVGGSELVHDPKNGVLIDNSKEHKSKLQLDAISRKHEGACQHQRLIKMNLCITS